MSKNYAGTHGSQNEQAKMQDGDCVSQCPACEFEPCPVCVNTTSELDREQRRISGLYLRLMAGSFAGGAILGAAIVVGLVGYLPVLIGLVSALFLAMAGLFWMFGDNFVRLGGSPSENRDLRAISVRSENPTCTCVGGV